MRAAANGYTESVRQTSTIGNVDTQRGADFLEWVVRVGAAAAIILIVAAVIVAYQNLGSRTIALATSALVGFVVTLVVQLWFELRPSTSEDQVSFAYTTDFQERQIRQWDYTKAAGDGKTDALGPTAALVGGSRIGFEVEAGKWLFAEHESAVKDRPDRVASDLAIFSLVAFFGHVERDWQMKYRRYNNPAMPHAMIGGISSPDQCSVVTEQDLRRQLGTAGNLFAASPSRLALADICLPRGTSMRVGSNQIALRNRAFEIVFALEDTGQRGANHSLPLAPMQRPKLANGTFQYDTRGLSFDVRTTFPALHAYDRNRPAYEAWSARLVEHLKAWFACC